MPQKCAALLLACTFLFLAARGDLRSAELLSSLPSNEGGDWFGRDVSLSGNMALVFSRHAPPPPDSENYGIGSIFKNVLNATGTVTEHTRLTVRDDSDPGGMYFGRVSVSGNMALLADRGEEAAYLYRDIIGNDGTLYESLKLLPSAQFPFDWDFGAAVSLSGTVALIGAPGDGQDNQRSGCVFVYTNLHTTLGTVAHEHATLRRSDAVGADGFGYFVHHDGNIGLVGHPFSDDGVSFPTGTAYLYQNLIIAQGHNNTERAKLFASDGQAGDYFGAAVAVSGTTGLVGAPNAGVTPGREAVYVFRNLDAVTIGPVTENLKLVASDSAGSFAFAVSLAGNAAIVGAPYDQTSRGGVYIFRDVSTATGTIAESAKVLASDGVEDNEFGYSVSASGDYFLVGAPQVDEPGDEGWRNVGKGYLGSFSSMTILDAGNTSRNIDGLSFSSREDWIIGQTTDANTVRLFVGDAADVTAAGKGVYIGLSGGSDSNTLIIEGHLSANLVQIGSIGGSRLNALRLENTATSSIGVIRIAPGNKLVIEGISTAPFTLFNYLGSTQLQVLVNGVWTTVTPDNHEPLINLSAAPAGSSGTIIAPDVFALSAVSRKTHGTAGTWDVNLPVSGVPLGIESRRGSGTNQDAHKIVVTFLHPVTLSGGPE
ncbi:MAG TPA: FG-GAP repeat protein, partial [Chthoniobacterales bacterium]